MMATNKPRFPITFEPEVAEIIEDYRHKNRISSTSKAAVALICKGIEVLYEQEAKKKAKKNKAPTEESAAEALYEVLHYYLEHQPTKEEIVAFRTMIPSICTALKGLMPL
jgi:hypothetical protein